MSGRVIAMNAEAEAELARLISERTGVDSYLCPVCHRPWGQHSDRLEMLDHGQQALGRKSTPIVKTATDRLVDAISEAFTVLHSDGIDIDRANKLAIAVTKALHLKGLIA